MRRTFPRNKLLIFALLATSNLSTFSNQIPKMELLKSTIRWTPHAILTGVTLSATALRAEDWARGAVAVGKQGHKAPPPADVKKLRNDFLLAVASVGIVGCFITAQASQPRIPVQKIPGILIASVLGIAILNNPIRGPDSSYSAQRLGLFSLFVYAACLA